MKRFISIVTIIFVSCLISMQAHAQLSKEQLAAIAKAAAAGNAGNSSAKDDKSKDDKSKERVHRDPPAPVKPQLTKEQIAQMEAQAQQIEDLKKTLDEQAKQRDIDKKAQDERDKTLKALKDDLDKRKKPDAVLNTNFWSYLWPYLLGLIAIIAIPFIILFLLYCGLSSNRRQVANKIKEICKHLGLT